MEFSNKVSFILNGKKYIGRICNILGNDVFEVLTTGEDGNIWTLNKTQLTLI